MADTTIQMKERNPAKSKVAFDPDFEKSQSHFKNQISNLMSEISSLKKEGLELDAQLAVKMEEGKPSLTRMVEDPMTVRTICK